MKTFKYRIQTMYPLLPELRILFTKNKIRIRYGIEDLYLTKSMEYENEVCFTDIEKLGLPKSKVETDVFMLDGWREEIYIDGVFVMDLALFNKEREIVNKLLRKLFDTDIYDKFNNKYLNFLREHSAKFF
jgi:uncharacterized protein YprB with RNaseH-like and TPR domain